MRIGTPEGGSDDVSESCQPGRRVSGNGEAGPSRPIKQDLLTFQQSMDI